MLWRSVAAWADAMYAWAAEYGYQGQVVTVDEVRGAAGGAEELQGAAEEIIVRAAQCLVGYAYVWVGGAARCAL